MPEWLIWMAVIWFIVGLSGRGSCGRSDGTRRRHGRLSGAGDLTDLTGLMGGDGRALRASGRANRGRTAPRPPETAEARLQRQFVEGRLSMEEYEAALWRELGPR